MKKQNGLIVWLTGLPGSGKTTIAEGVKKYLRELAYNVIVLDGDVLRKGICSDLGYSIEDRIENNRRIGEVAQIFLNEGYIVIVAVVSPVESARNILKQKFGRSFVEVYCKCSIETCIKRDPKGLYAKAATGNISNFTGVSAEYEVPKNPSFVLNTEFESSAESINLLSTIVLLKSSTGKCLS